MSFGWARGGSRSIFELAHRRPSPHELDSGLFSSRICEETREHEGKRISSASHRGGSVKRSRGNLELRSTKGRRNRLPHTDVPRFCTQTARSPSRYKQRLRGDAGLLARKTTKSARVPPGQGPSTAHRSHEYAPDASSPSQPLSRRAHARHPHQRYLLLHHSSSARSRPDDPCPPARHGHRS